jgi:hypothetical protein
MVMIPMVHSAGIERLHDVAAVREVEEAFE